MRAAVKKDMAHADVSQSKHLAELRDKLDKILIEVLSLLALLVLYWYNSTNTDAAGRADAPQVCRGREARRR